MFSRIVSASQRLAYGAGRVGVLTTVMGLARLLFIKMFFIKVCRIHTNDTRLTFVMNCPTQLMPLLVVFNELIEPELALVKKVLHRDAIAVDIGASIGTWTLFAVSTGATVHACEPDPENFISLARNLGLNQASATPIHQVAIGASSGTCVIANRPAKRYLTHFDMLPHVGTGTSEQIEMLTLADFMCANHITCIDVLKINTAGREIDVLSGAKGPLLDGRVRLVLILDSLAVRRYISNKEFLEIFDIGYYDNALDKLNSITSEADFAKCVPRQMNRYVIMRLKGGSVLRPAKMISN